LSPQNGSVYDIGQLWKIPTAISPERHVSLVTRFWQSWEYGTLRPLINEHAVSISGIGSSTPPTPTPTPNPNGTPAGTYTIVVTAMSGNTTQTQNLTLTVQ